MLGNIILEVKGNQLVFTITSNFENKAFINVTLKFKIQIILDSLTF